MKIYCYTRDFGSEDNPKINNTVITNVGVLHFVNVPNIGDVIHVRNGKSYKVLCREFCDDDAGNIFLEVEPYPVAIFRSDPIPGVPALTITAPHLATMMPEDFSINVPDEIRSICTIEAED